MSDVQLLIDSASFGGWKKISIRRSMDIFGGSFDLTLTQNSAVDARSIKLGSACKVTIDGEVVITGYVDRIRPGHKGKSRALEISGRSKAADLVDCSVPMQDTEYQRNNQTLLQLASYIAKKFGISVSSSVRSLPKVVFSNIEPGQTVYEYLEKHTRQAAILMMDMPSGDVLLTRASNERVSTALVLGENILEADGEFSERNRFSEYHLPAQLRGWDENSGEQSAHILGKASDLVSRYRPTVINAGNITQAMANEQAKWQRNVNYGRSRQATYTVNGWRHEHGLWNPNTNVFVNDEWMGFVGNGGDGEWLMIGTVEMVLDEHGERTALSVMPREAYDQVALPSSSGGAW